MDRLEQMEQIADKQHSEMLTSNLELDIGDAAEQIEADGEAYEKELEKEEAEADEAENILSSDEILERFQEEFPTLLDSDVLHQRFNDRVDDMILGDDRDPHDWTIYEQAAKTVLKRAEEIEEDPTLEPFYSREDAILNIQVKGFRQDDLDMKAQERLEKKPETPEQILERFNIDFSDLDEQGRSDAARIVDEAHKDRYIETGQDARSIFGDMETYQRAGEIAGTTQAIKEISASRGKVVDE